LNVFAAWALKSGLAIELSPAGRTAEQLINALGGLRGLRTVGSEELLRVLDRMANGTLEVEIEPENDSVNLKRRLRKASIPLAQIDQVLKRASAENPMISIDSIVSGNVLALGMEIACSHCEQSTWFSLEEVANTLKCPRCLREFGFPVTAPRKIKWSYKVQGPFAIQDYAQGAYSVAFGLRFLAERVNHQCTWIPSFTLRQEKGGQIEAEPDFGAFVRPTGFSNRKNPMLFFGECKSFGNFTSRDFQRMNSLAKMFSGAAICFCTLKSALTKSQKRPTSEPCACANWY
jgi:hypothetical protein